ncbi:hypothetical protein ACFYSF_22440 [Streptomyces canus]|uniref:hypothetical protein n=1 Tax=Streptomyces canus TaxID=58343 RepID=UPI0036C27E22
MRRVRNEQRVTLRLSRQRPGKVRQRERAEAGGAEGKPRQWRDLTVIASLLAVLLAVPGTVWAVLVAQSQLNQADEAAVKEERAQASRVSSWASQDAHGKWLFHVMNRSPDPIARVFLSFAPWIPDAKDSPRWAVMVMSVPPCTDMTIRQGQLRYNVDHPVQTFDRDQFNMPEPSSPPKGKGWRPLDQRNRYWELGDVDFTDRNGVDWVRRGGGGLERQHGRLSAVGNGVLGQVFGALTYRTVEECGEGT